MSRRKKSATVQSTTTRSFRESRGSWYRWYVLRDEPAEEAVGSEAPGRRRSPCTGREWPPGPASGTGRDARRHAGSWRVGAPGEGRAGRWAGRDGRASPRWARARRLRAPRRSRGPRRAASRRRGLGPGRRAAARTVRAEGGRERRPSTRAFGSGASSRPRASQPRASSEARVVPTRMSTPRPASSRAAYSPSRGGISGRIFGAASTSTQRCGALRSPG